MLLKTIVEKGLFAHYHSAADWRDAIEKSCVRLEETGIVHPGYAQDIIQCVEKFGPYIVLIPGIAMPHSNEGDQLAASTAIAFTCFDEPVMFDESDREKDATVFLTLAAKDHDEHLKNMQQLFKLLTDDDLVARLQQVKNPEDLLALDI